jgi:hypothetical protein
MTKPKLMKTNIKPDYFKFVLSILAPYFATIFFIRISDLSFLFLIPIYLISLVLLIYSTIKIRKIEPDRNKKIIYLAVSIIAVMTFFFTYTIQLDAANYISFKFKENSLNEFVGNIKSYKKITQLSDEYENLNGYPTITKNNTNIFIELGEHYPIEEIQDKFSIDSLTYEAFRHSLKSIGYRSFSVLEDGSVSFTQGGMIDNCYGIAYSETGNKPTENDCGRIIRWTKISTHWYSWSTT